MKGSAFRIRGSLWGPLWGPLGATALLAMLMTAGCLTTAPENSAPRPAGGNEEPNCFNLCFSVLPGLCADFNKAGCERACLRNWSDDTLDCMAAASSCDQISANAPYCRPRPDQDLAPAPPPTPPLDAACDRACRNYRTCAGYGDDVTSADQDAAYASCMEVCADWSDDSKACMARVQVRGPADCSRVSACGLRASMP